MLCADLSPVVSTKKVWVCFIGERKSISFSTQTDEGRERREKISELLRSGLTPKEVHFKSGASWKLMASIRGTILSS